MRSTRHRLVRLCGIAVGVAVSLAGCSPSEIAHKPDTASEAGRDVFKPGAERPAVDSESAVAATARSTHGRDAADEARPPIEPVVAPRPAVAETAIASAAMSITDSGDAIAAAETPRIVDPALDPSQFPGGIIPASPNAQPLPGGPRLLVPERTFRAEGRPRALRVNYDDLDLLKVLNMGDPLPADVVDQFPDWLKELDGKTIRLRGFMYPSYQQEMNAFILTRDTGECCFGPNAKVYYLVGVKLKEGETVRYIGDRPFDVVGTFHIAPFYNEGQWYQLYKISDATVIQ
ncbi:MAG: hypothetical protein WBC44_21690 [Planctomycetaceae bacterium]